MSKIRAVFRGGPPAVPGALPQRWEVLVCLRELARFVEEPSWLWPRPADPLLELILRSFPTPAWKGRPPALSIVETRSEEELSALAREAMRVRVPALLVAPRGLPLPLRLPPELPLSLVRVVVWPRGEDRAHVALRVGRALEALIQAHAYRERGRHSARLLTTYLQELLDREEPLPTLSSEPLVTSLDTMLWSHARIVRGFGFGTVRKVSSDLGVSANTARRYLDTPPTVLAAAHLEAALEDRRVEELSTDELRERLFARAAFVHALVGERSALEEARIGDPSLSLAAFEDAVKEATFEATKTRQAAQRRLAIGARRLRRKAVGRRARGSSGSGSAGRSSHGAA